MAGYGSLGCLPISARGGRVVLLVRAVSGGAWLPLSPLLLATALEHLWSCAAGLVPQLSSTLI